MFIMYYLCNKLSLCIVVGNCIEVSHKEGKKILYNESFIFVYEVAKFIIIPLKR